MEMILGTAQLCRMYGIVSEGAVLDEVAAVRLLRVAEQLGFDAIDTAPAYGDAERLIGDAEVALPVHTKIAPGEPPESSLARSCERLRRPTVDVAYLHDSTEVLNEHGRVLSEASALVGRLTRALGASVYDPSELSAAEGDHRITVVQGPSNVFDRRLADLLPGSVRGDLRFYARSVFLQGVLISEPERMPARIASLRPFITALQHAAAELRRSTIELALGWVRGLPGVSGVIVGAASERDLHGIVEAFSAPALAADELTALRAMDVPPFELCDPRRW